MHVSTRHLRDISMYVPWSCYRSPFIYKHFLYIAHWQLTKRNVKSYLQLSFIISLSSLLHKQPLPFIVSLFHLHKQQYLNMEQLAPWNHGTTCGMSPFRWLPVGQLINYYTTPIVRCFFYQRTKLVCLFLCLGGRSPKAYGSRRVCLCVCCSAARFSQQPQWIKQWKLQCNYSSTFYHR